MIYKDNGFEIKRIRVKSKSLSDNLLHDPIEREIILLEREVNEGTPILIGLAGFYGSSDSFLQTRYTGLDFQRTLNQMIKKTGIKSFIIALPDTMNSYYGNQYINSIAVGNYEDFIVKDVLNALWKRYGKRKVGVFGKSSGGFGSYTLTVRHPEIFDGFVDVSGDSGFEYCYIKDFPSTIAELSRTGLTRFLKEFKKKPHPNVSELTTMNMIAMSAFYSPNDKSALKFDLPFDLRTYKLNDEVWKKWLDLDPLRNINLHLNDLKDKKIILQVGRKDEFSINVGIRGMSRILSKNHISHTYKDYDEGHFGIEYLYEYSLSSLISSLME